MNWWARTRWRRRGVRIDVARGAAVEIGRDVVIGAGTRVAVRAGTLRIGDGAHIGERCDVVVHAGVDIAPHARVEDWVSITDVEPIFDDPEVPIRLQGVRARAIRVGERAVVDHAANLTAGAVVRPGTRVQPHEIR